MGSGIDAEIRPARFPIVPQAEDACQALQGRDAAARCADHGCSGPADPRPGAQGHEAH